MKKIYYLLILSCTLLSCSSDDNRPKVKREFTSYLINNVSIKNHAFNETDGSYEIGWVFASPTGGKVVELGGLFPEAGTYTVTLWDAETEDVLAQVEITASAGKLAMRNIDAVTIDVDKDYIVSYNTFSGRDYYWLEPEVSIYPLQLSGITVYGQVEISTFSVNPVFPGTSTNTTIVGVPEIGFIKN